METGSTQMEAGLNHVHDLGDIVTNQRTKTEKFRFLLWSWYNTADIDAGTQNPNLPLERAGGRRDMSGRGVVVADMPLGSPEVYGIGSARGGIDLIPNLIPDFEKHGKHGEHGKVVVNERISLR